MKYIGWLALVTQLLPPSPGVTLGLGAAGSVHVGEDRLVHADPKGLSLVEPHLSIDPSDPRRMVAGAMVARPDGTCAVAGFTSHDAGRTWARPDFPVLDGGDIWTAVLPGGECVSALLSGDRSELHLFVSPDGTLLVPFADYRRPGTRRRLESSRDWVVSSTDGGRTFSEPMLISESCNGAGGWSSLAAGVIPGGTGERVYHVCTAQQFDGILLRSSDTAGDGWTDEVRIDRPGGISPYTRTPAIAVNAQGIVGVAWYDGRDDRSVIKGSLRCQDIYFAASLDGGRTFLPEVKVSSAKTCPSDQRNIATALRFPAGGEYMGLAAAPDGTFHLLWADSRDGVYQLRGATASTHTAAQPNGGGHRESGRESWQKVSEIFEAMQVKPGAVVADIGAGDGFFTSRLAKAVGSDGRVHAVDVAADALRRLRKRVEDDALANVSVIEGSVEDPRLPDGSLDAILIVNAYHEMTAPQAMLAKMKAALRPGGRLVIVEPIAPSRRERTRQDQTRNHEIAAAFVRADARAAGFREVVLRDPFTARPQDRAEQWMLVLTPQTQETNDRAAEVRSKGVPR
ncbi:MAG: methyltransferase domain-containing protein [Acidobacteria bacterium]|nr:methyltransferase domain-containing protein [Acidobacteriota bacterium]